MSAAVKKGPSGCAIVAAAVGLGFAAMVGQCSTKLDEVQKQEAARVAALTPEQRKAEEAAKAAADRAYSVTRDLRGYMRNPDSFEVIRITGNADASRLCIVYRAQNGFGGMSVERAALRKGRLHTDTNCKALAVDYTGAGWTL